MSNACNVPCLLEQQRELNGAEGIICVGARGQAEHAEQHGALIVDEHLVDLSAGARHSLVR